MKGWRITAKVQQGGLENPSRPAEAGDGHWAAGHGDHGGYPGGSGSMMAEMRVFHERDVIVCVIESVI